MAELDLEVLHIAECPGWEPLLGSVERALAELGVAARVTTRLIATEAEAGAAGFAGSPTLLIDGRDPFPAADGTTGLACRVYRIEGRLAPRPSDGQVRDAIRAALGARR